MTNLLQQVEKVALFIKLGKHEEAIKLSMALLTLFPKEAVVFYYLARSHALAGNFEQAESVIKDSFKVDANFSATHGLLGMIMMQKGKFKASEKSLQQALTLDPENAANHGRLAKLYIYMDRNAEAVRHAKQGLAIKPTDEDCLSNLYRAYVAQKKVKEAQAVLTKSLEAYPESKEILVNLGNDLVDKGRPKEAKEVFESILKIDSHYDAALRGLRKTTSMNIKAPKWLSTDIVFQAVYWLIILLAIVVLILSFDPEFPFTATQVMIFGFVQLVAMMGVPQATGQIRAVLTDKKQGQLYGTDRLVNSIFTLLSLVFSLAMMVALIPGFRTGEFNMFYAFLLAYGIIFQLVFSLRVHEYSLKKWPRRVFFYLVAASALSAILLYPQFQLLSLIATFAFIILDFVAYKGLILKRWYDR